MFAGDGAGGKKKAPAPAPEVSWNESSSDTGLADPLTNAAPVGETPRESRAWITKDVESGSEVPGLATVFGAKDQPPSASCPLVKNLKASLETVGVAAPCATSPATASAVELVSAPSKSAGNPLHGLNAL